MLLVVCFDAVIRSGWNKLALMVPRSTWSLNPGVCSSPPFALRKIETRIDTAPGDYVFVPPFVPHREENPDPDGEAVVVIARTTQEAIVVNLDGLDWSAVRLDEAGVAGSEC